MVALYYLKITIAQNESRDGQIDWVCFLVAILHDNIVTVLKFTNRFVVLIFFSYLAFNLEK